MKKLLALLLVLCMAIGLMACTATPDPTEPSEDPTPSESQNVEDPKPTESTAPAKPFAGKTLQIWGLAQGDYAKIDVLEEKKNMNYIWMQNAAVIEWAEMNEVTIEITPSYNQNAILAAMNGGTKPDLVFIGSNQYPNSRNLGILQAMTAEQRAEIEDIIGGTMYTNIIAKGDTCYGISLPWQGVETIWFNKTLFETYGVKSPYDYILEGNWTWKTMMQCAKDITKDLDGDGVFDIYGFGIANFARQIPQYEEDANGKIKNIIDTDRMREFITMIYEGMRDGYIKTGNETTTKLTGPRPAMHVGDGSIEDKATFRDTRLTNGEILARCPSPIRSKEDPWHMNAISPNFYAMGNNTDEPEAAFDLMKYILKVGMEWRYEFKMNDGVSPWPKPKYEGLQGTSDYSKRFLKVFEDKKAEFDKAQDEIVLTADEQKLWEMFKKTYAEDAYFTTVTYEGVTRFLGVAANYSEPPASMIATLKPTLDAQVDTYNDLYVH